ncbi:TBC1 domain family member 12-like [Saccostrea cucullata]|uniref:TBC1 domain family member 12-like n=1 Tax=Saccostrea cuccullata TaxID=36930 RepID=UPI002ED095DF
MRLDMCDSLPPTSIITSSGSLLEGNHESDISVLKSRVRKCNFDEDSKKPCFSDIPSSPESGSEHEFCSTNFTDQGMCSHLSNSGESDVHSDFKRSKSENGVSESDITKLDCDANEQNLKQNGIAKSQSDSNFSNVKRADAKELKSGLLISPISLTQDLPITVGQEDDNRLSSVLEKISTPLVYLPNTRQLVTETSKDSIDSKSETNLDVNNVTETGSEEDSTSICDKWKLVNLQDTSSIGETDSLLRLKDPDQLTCNSFDLEGSFHRVQTGDSLLRTFNDASSLSSLSTCTDFSVSAVSVGDDASDGTGMCLDTGDGNFIEVNLHSRNSFDRCKNNSSDSGIEEQGAKPKRRGISGFLSRGLFSRKSKEEEEDQGWKLFGRVPPKQGVVKPPQQISNEYQQRNALQNPNRTKKSDVEVMSTTALILENRPQNLPTKDPEEAERHRLQYEAMIEAAKKKEQRDIKLKKKLQQQQLKQEDQMLQLSKRWASEILPNWESMKSSKRTRDMWWQGLPTNVRGKVWKLAIGNDLNLTPELYEICANRAEDRIKQTCDSDTASVTESVPEVSCTNRESSVELIKLDISRTFPQLCIFQKGGPYHDLLHSLLGAYACYRPDVGYVQGMSFIAAVLLLNMDVADAFICFANLLNRPCQVAFFRIDEAMMKFYFQTYEEFFKENMPALFRVFNRSNVTPDIYLIDWIFSLYSKSLPLDIACRIWDIFCRDGEEFLFRTALGILKLYEDILINQEFILLAQFLTKLPEDISSESLFKSIEMINMNIDKKKFSQILASKKEQGKTDQS